MEEKDNNQQVMGPQAERNSKLVPKFKYDGGSPGVFLRDFLVVASAFGVANVYGHDWDDGKELSEEEEQKNTLALLVLRQYLTERVLNVIMVGQPRLASTVYKTLKTIFLCNDARTKVQVTKELHGCEME